MKLEIINEVKENPFMKFLLLMEKANHEIFKEPPENITAGIDLLKYIAKGEGEDLERDDIIHAIKVYHYLAKLLLAAKSPLEDDYDAVRLAREYERGEGKFASAMRQPKVGV